MIYTVTLNPAVDYNIRLNSEIKNGINLAAEENIHFGGKGINVAVILKRLNVPCVATGFIAGFTGKAILSNLMLEGIKTDFIEVDGFTRINVKIKGEPETEINGSGPFINEQSLMALINKLKTLNENDIVVLSGSLPSNLKPDTYKRIISELNKNNVKCCLDTSGEALKQAISEKPFLIKPNLQELSFLLGKKLTVEKEVILGAKMLQKFGAQNVLVSMGSMGAIILTKDGSVFKREAKQGKVINTVGSGDSLLAGFLKGLENGNISKALKLGCAAGSATAFSEGLATKSLILEIYNDK